MRAAIHSPNDPGATLKRANTVLALYFDPDHDPKVKAAVRQEFVVALDHYPDWAVQRAFDKWVATSQRRPTPGDIAILAQREVKPIHEEISRREREAEDRRTYRDDLSEEELAQRRAAAAQIMANAGFARNVARPSGPVRETVTDEDRAEMAAMLNSKGLGANP